MSALSRGLVLGALQLALLCGVGAKFLLDRASYPRIWVETGPVDPELPVRGRYVRLSLRVDAGREPVLAGRQQRDMTLARLEARDGRLHAVPDPEGRHWIQGWRCGEADCWQLEEPVAFFIPEDVVDPSLRAPGEALWVEVTVPPSGAPRPIRLGVMKDGELRPLSLR